MCCSALVKKTCWSQQRVSEHDLRRVKVVCETICRSLETVGNSTRDALILNICRADTDMSHPAVHVRSDSDALET